MNTKVKIKNNIKIDHKNLFFYIKNSICKNFFLITLLLLIEMTFMRVYIYIISF